MSGAREEILARVRRAEAAAEVAVPRDYRGAGGTPHPDPVALFAERVDEYRAAVHRCAPAAAAATVARVLRDAGARRVVVPAGLPDDLLAGLGGDVETVADDPPLSPERLDAADAVLTTCACAIALTGTVVLDHRAGQGRRALTLVPDRHVVIVRADQVVVGVPDAIAALDPTRPQTWISGPSATSDIELERVEGVHGPRRLDVLIVG